MGKVVSETSLRYHVEGTDDGRIEGISGVNRVPMSADLTSHLSRYLSKEHRLDEEN